jgi:beta-mannosidase
LIWHDMMFACAMYPAEGPMLENIKLETIDNVKRLRNHPSIALWNGNNEVLIGWEHWGWQDDLNQTQKDIVFGWYQDIFEKTLPEVIAVHDPDRFYWPTSPTSQAPGNYSFGDIHQWTVWGGAGDIELYN